MNCFTLFSTKEILNHDIFPPLQVFKLYSSQSNNFGGKLWYLDMINIQRQTIQTAHSMMVIIISYLKSYNFLKY